jgi:predicted restriction endonuclease
MQRTPSSVAMKLSNLASLDPVITSNGRKGLAGASTLDKTIWQEFSENTEALMPVAEGALHSVLHSTEDTPTPTQGTYQELDHYSNVKVRKGQKLFRDAVLSAYENCCCVTGLSDPRFLIASHIRPWREDTKNRLNPRNGLCLSLMFYKAFDIGLITFSEDFRLVISSELKHQENNPYMANTFLSRKGQKIQLPSKFSPDETFLSWHRTSYFVGKPL